MATISSLLETTQSEEQTETLGAYTWSYPLPPTWLVVTAIVTVVVMVTVGVPGNILIVLVYKRKNDNQNAANLFIATLAVVDCVTCGFVVPSLPFIMTSNTTVLYSQVWWSASVSVVVLSVWLLVAIAADHYRAICRPLSPHMSPTVAWVIVIVGCLVSMVLGATLRIGNLPGVKATLGFDLFRWSSGLYLMVSLSLLAVLYANIFWFLIRRKKVGMAVHLSTAPSATGGVTMETGITVSKDTRAGEGLSADQIPSSLAGKSIVTSQISESGTTAESSTLPSRSTSRAPGQVTVSPSTGQEVIQGGANQPRLQKGVRKTAKMLAVVTILFVLSYTPTYVLPAVLSDYNFAYVFTHFINHAANPFIYSFMNQRFRKEVRQLFRSRQVHPY